MQCNAVTAEVGRNRSRRQRSASAAHPPSVLSWRADTARGVSSPRQADLHATTDHDAWRTVPLYPGDRPCPWHERTFAADAPALGLARINRTVPVSGVSPLGCAKEHCDRHNPTATVSKDFSAEKVVAPISQLTSSSARALEGEGIDA